ncbi:hypothetical protein BT96DRAFT_887996 [Gymnopus androsaceus JB14]|uniref:Uncharacterized protein n=1 Tax=Gymnopus androsaceus JB14 TaxID=1447944 RepID=A0A6A4H2Y3_9AGAR|nr:hypothetical protein BT96DRAFT_887996 [Gymnopus androsaceus JB14]
MTELPKPDSVFNEEYNAKAKSLYRLVYDAQSSANNKKELIYCRIVGYLLLHPINLTARGAVLNELASIHGLDGTQPSFKIYELGKMYLEHLIRPFRKHKGKSPFSSSHVSRPSFDRQREDTKAILQDNPTSHTTAKKKALMRDGYRCIISGRFDRSSLVESEALRKAVYSSWTNDEIRHVATECAHIFADATNAGITGDSEAQSQKREIFWTILEKFGYPKFSEELNGPGIHRLDNVMTLDHNAHDPFDELALWLEAVDGVPNTYKIQTSYTPEMIKGLDLPTHVTFSHQSALRVDPSLAMEPKFPDNLPLPNPEYLHIHASVCKIAHMSGAAGYIDYIFRKMEDIGVLSEDGTSADVIEGALSFLTNAPRSVAISAFRRVSGLQK